MYCVNCGAILKDNTRFCTQCGAEITSSANNTQSQQAEQPHPEAQTQVFYTSNI
ncbi:hypothetical protein CJI48_01265, partial [Bifidobacteriaceae bacterium GH005]